MYQLAGLELTLDVPIRLEHRKWFVEKSLAGSGGFPVIRLRPSHQGGGVAESGTLLRVLTDRARGRRGLVSLQRAHTATIRLASMSTHQGIYGIRYGASPPYRFRWAPSRIALLSVGLVGLRDVVGGGRSLCGLTLLVPLYDDVGGLVEVIGHVEQVDVLG